MKIKNTLITTNVFNSSYYRVLQANKTKCDRYRQKNNNRFNITNKKNNLGHILKTSVLSFEHIRSVILEYTEDYLKYHYTDRYQKNKLLVVFVR